MEKDSLCVVLKVHTFLARWLSWLERRPVTAEVVGSNPIRVVYPQGYILISEYGILAQLGEHLPYKQRVTGSSPTRGVWLLGQVVKTPPFHGGNMGSNPVGVTCGVVAKW